MLDFNYIAMSNGTQTKWQCVNCHVTLVLQGVDKALPSCPFCRAPQPGFTWDQAGRQEQPPSADRENQPYQGSHVSDNYYRSTHGNECLLCGVPLHPNTESCVACGTPVSWNQAVGQLFQASTTDHGQYTPHLMSHFQPVSQKQQQHQQLSHHNGNEQHEETAASQQEQGNPQHSGTVDCDCGAQFRPGARACAECGKPPPRNQPQGPPCFHCGQRLIKESASRCASCGKRQPGTPTKLTETPTLTSLSPGYGYPNAPQHQPGMTQTLHPTTEMIFSRPVLPSIYRLPMMFGASATTPTYYHIQPCNPIYPTNTQAYFGLQPSASTDAQASTTMPSNIQKQAQLSAPVSQGSPTGVSGVPPPSQGNSRSESRSKEEQVSNNPSVPSSARPTKDPLSRETNSALLKDLSGGQSNSTLQLTSSNGASEHDNQVMPNINADKLDELSNQTIDVNNNRSPDPLCASNSDDPSHAGNRPGNQQPNPVSATGSSNKDGQGTTATEGNGSTTFPTPTNSSSGKSHSYAAAVTGQKVNI